MLTLAQTGPVDVQPVTTTTTTATPGSTINPGMIFLLALYFLISLCLVFTILAQTTKSEGLSGTIGGRSEAVFKGKGPKTVEEKLNQITTGLAIAFLVLSTMISIIGF